MHHFILWIKLWNSAKQLNRVSDQTIISLMSQNHSCLIYQCKNLLRKLEFYKYRYVGQFLSTYSHLKSVYTRAAMKVKLSTTATSTWSLIPSITESLSSFKLWTSAWWLAITALKCKKKYIHIHIKTYKCTHTFET